ncbi:hypothetical protein NG800_013700 [Epilithonimonas ginsengisoli]|uniref:Uncharacterized protein n=1 Tax=Epilithonimonas ginsengisoli TaxID=1245592 RepID=A0ABU4JJU9_9FLAO|nr:MULTISPECIES: hypothetical protein [Chryseobacterium group]MBV6881041.1 hypothetical protein [Epilithonimonas sp. FP105]MDW8549974.1 hypothetical protein [Epilithonimonas ginsengisoli]OAH76516.1 hypothetical protein AXA65_00545 [Chryseobacterium sp. FP211-J200]
MEEIYKGKIESLELPFSHDFEKEVIWVKIVGYGKISLSNDDEFEDIIQQFEIVDRDIKEGLTKIEIKSSQLETPQYPNIDIEKNSEKYVIKLYKNGYPFDPQS